MTIAAGLPKEFADLAPLAAVWALPTENARSARRWRATPAEFEEFYRLFMPRLPAVLERLEAAPAANPPAELATLLHLTLAFAEVSPHVELYRGSAQVPNSFEAERFVAAHGTQAG